MQKKILICRVDALIRNALNPLQDEVYQRRVWFGRLRSNEVSTYTDVMDYCLDRCESIFQDSDCETMLGKDNYTLLKQLYELVYSHADLTEDRLGTQVEPREDDLLNDPAWHDIQSLARDVQIRLLDFLKREGHKYE